MKIHTIAKLGFVFLSVNSFQAFSMDHRDMKRAKNPAEARAIGNNALRELDELRGTGGGGAAAALPSEIRALVECVNENSCAAYVTFSKEAFRAKVMATIGAGADKDALRAALNTFIDTLAIVSPADVPIPGAGAAAMGGNPAASEVKTLNALKCAIDVAMVQKVNEEMDRLATAPGVAQPIKDALMAVFAGR